MKIRPVGTELMHVDGQTDRQTGSQTYRRRTDGQTDRWKDRRTDRRQMDRHEEANSLLAILQTRLKISG